MNNPFAYVGEVFTMTVDAGRDVTDHTSAKVIFSSPSGVAKQLTATHEDDTLFNCDVDADFLDEEGEWQAQVEVTFAAGPRRGRVTSFKVGEGLDEPSS